MQCFFSFQEGKFHIGQNSFGHSVFQQVERTLSGLAEHLVTLCSSAFGIVHRVMFFTEIGGHVVGYEHTFGVGINHELFFVFQVGQ